MLLDYRSTDASLLVQGYMTDRVGARPLLLSCLISFIIWAGLLCIDQLPYICFVLLLVGVGISSRCVSTSVSHKGGTDLNYVLQLHYNAYISLPVDRRPGQ